LLELTLFQEGGEISRVAAAGKKVRVAVAGVDRKPSGEPFDGTIVAAKMQGNLGKVTVQLGAEAKGFAVSSIARLWLQ
jgi:hypothetical protein